MHWFTYAAIAAWLLTVGVWLFRMNEALAKYNPLFIIPLLQACPVACRLVASSRHRSE